MTVVAMALEEVEELELEVLVELEVLQLGELQEVEMLVWEG